MRACGKH